MRQRIRDVSCAFAVAVTSLCASPLAHPATQEDEISLRSFSALSSRVAVGDRVSIRETSGDRVDGKFHSVDYVADALVLTDAKRTPEEGEKTKHNRLEIPERSIQEVWLVRRHSGARGAAIGAAVGVGVGALLYAIDTGVLDEIWLTTGAVFFSPIGAVVGYFSDRGEAGRELIYTIDPPASSFGWHIAPFFSGDRCGAGLSLSF